ncbi:N-acetylmuramate alpha-1-phosphate uridylyltransferase MurU [Deefgea salmonis]|uniref:Nucleotidyltransferase family protein n=1 Tax=Deefgea salmonis TaxID=2875502 RepID=A0ABS8BLV2_9NEIS|nr:nucleotidyltransferase family protein [Deefgea salmonis]MCB5196710.1 nucleotidyltransferase family protein [Deefgea salmonis]
MKAMILAAGRGERMRPLTDVTPKPLLEVGGQPLIAWHLARLAAAGINDVVINHAWLGEQIEAALGDGSRWGVRIEYSAENTALETAAGIARALPLLGDAPFIVVNGDVLTDVDFVALSQTAAQLNAQTHWAHLMLVPKAGYPTGRDLSLHAGMVVPCQSDDQPLTFCGVAAYHPRFFADVPADQAMPLLPCLLTAMAAGRVRGECHHGQWLDVGTVERLALARAQYAVDGG